jgi:hypothetical protein
MTVAITWTSTGFHEDGTPLDRPSLTPKIKSQKEAAVHDSCGACYQSAVFA